MFYRKYIWIFTGNPYSRTRQRIGLNHIINGHMSSNIPGVHSWTKPSPAITSHFGMGWRLSSMVYKRARLLYYSYYHMSLMITKLRIIKLFLPYECCWDYHYACLVQYVPSYMHKVSFCCSLFFLNRLPVRNTFRLHIYRNPSALISYACTNASEAFKKVIGQSITRKGVRKFIHYHITTKCNNTKLARNSWNVLYFISLRYHCYALVLGMRAVIVRPMRIYLNAGTCR